MSVRIINSDVMDGLAQIPDESVHCVVTSPPYWGLRDYGVFGQLGLEPTLGEHIETMVRVFREVRRVLRKDGTLWLNYGDCYATSPNGRSAAMVKELSDDDRTFRDKPFSTIGPIYLADGGQVPDNKNKKARAGQNNNKGQTGADHGGRVFAGGTLKPKDLCGVPWRVAFALQADGWWLRQDIIWSKPNPMPESIKDRCTKAHEYMFLLAKSQRYYFDTDAIREEAEYGRRNWSDVNGVMASVGGGRGHATVSGSDPDAGRNKRSVWEIATQPFPEAHFATFPPALIEPCIKAGTSERGCCAKCGAPWVREQERNEVDQSANEVIKADAVPGLRPGTSADRVRKLSGSTYKHVRGATIGWQLSCKCEADTTASTILDPFAGSGTTGLVADRLKRNAILIELNPEYAAMAEKRIKGDCPMFAEVVA